MMFDRAAGPARRRPRPHPGGVAADPGDDDLRAAVADRPAERRRRCPTAFFRTLANLVAEALDHEAPLSLPTSEHPIVAAAMAYTKEHLDIGDRRRGQPRGRRCRSGRCDGCSRTRSGCRGGRISCTPGCCGRWRCWPRPGSRCRRRRRRSASTASVRSRGRSLSSAARRRRHTGKGLAAPGSDRCRPAGFSLQTSNSAGQRKATADKIPAESSSSSSAEPTSPGYTTRAIERC